LISHHDTHTALDKESSGGAVTEDKHGHSDGATAPASSGKTASGLEGLHGKALQHQQSEQSAQPSGEEVLGMGLQWLHSVYRSSATEDAELPKAPDSLQIELLQSLLHGVLSAPSQGNESISDHAVITKSTVVLYLPDSLHAGRCTMARQLKALSCPACLTACRL